MIPCLLVPFHFGETCSIPSVPGRTGTDFLSNFCLSPAGLNTSCAHYGRLYYLACDRIVWQDLPPPFFTDRAALSILTEWKVFANLCFILISSAQIWRVPAYKYLLIGCLGNHCFLQGLDRVFKSYLAMETTGNEGSELDFSARTSQSFIQPGVKPSLQNKGCNPK